jgi:flagellar hook-associated protein 3 FlgL
MRITDNMLTNQFLYNFNQSMSRAAEIQNQITTTKAINKPSDDPVKAVRSLQFRTSLSTNNMFSQNAADAISWMQTSDAAMTKINDLLDSVNTLVTGAIKPSPDIAFEAAAKQLDGYINELVNLGNTKFGERYLFAGQNDRSSTPPFSSPDASGNVTYSGTWDGMGSPADPYAGTVTMKVSPGETDPVRDKINVDGQDVFGTIDSTNQPAIFKELATIRAHLLSKDTTALSNDLGTLQSETDSFRQAQTSLGARQAVYQTMKDRLSSDYVTIKGDLSKNEDLDMSKASIDFQSAQNVYNAALYVGSRILPQSLVDYLK